MQQEAESIAAVIPETTKKPLDEIRAATMNRTLLTSDEAQKWGLVREIVKNCTRRCRCDPCSRDDLWTDRNPSGEIVLTTERSSSVTPNLLVFTKPPDFSAIHDSASALPTVPLFRTPSW